MSGWIKFDKDMANDPRLLEMAVRFATEASLSTGNTDMPLRDAVALFGNALRGALVTLWCYADEHITDGDTLNLSTLAIDAMVGIDGFCDAMPDEWLEDMGDNTVRLPEYCVKNGLISKRKRREAGNERQRRFKERQRTVTKRVSNAVSTTSSRAVDQDLDQDNRERSASKSKPSKRVPSDFLPDLTLATSEIPDIDAAAESQKFRDWEFKTPRSDWPAVWRTWIRNCKDTGKYSRKASEKWQ